jgi:hypothetical protein
MAGLMPSPLVESFELLTDVEQLAPRLEAAATAMAQLPELVHERAWLDAARERLATARGTSFGNLLDRALRLPELESLKGEHGKRLQAAIADEVERLQGAIAHAGTARSPLLEVLFHNLKIPALRKCARPELDKFCSELERRLASSYTRRVLATERYRPVQACEQTLAAAVATWRSVFIEPPLDEETAETVREELAAAGRAVEMPVRQARLLAQAALLPAAELLDGEGVLLTRRGKAKDDAHPLLEQDPPDPLLPMADERAEIAALHGSS